MVCKSRVLINSQKLVTSMTKICREKIKILKQAIIVDALNSVIIQGLSKAIEDFPQCFLGEICAQGLAKKGEKNVIISKNKKIWGMKNSKNL